MARNGLNFRKMSPQEISYLPGELPKCWLANLIKNTFQNKHLKDLPVYKHVLQKRCSLVIYWATMVYYRPLKKSLKHRCFCKNFSKSHKVFLKTFSDDRVSIFQKSRGWLTFTATKNHYVILLKNKTLLNYLYLICHCIF